MSGYAGRHRDALTGAPTPTPADPSRRRAILLAAVAVTVVLAGLFAIPFLTQVGDGAPTPAAPTVPPEAGLPLLSRQGDLGDLAEKRQEVGSVGTSTTTPDGLPTDPATTATTSPTDESSPGALAASAAQTPGSTTGTTGTTRTAPRTPTGSSSTTPGTTSSSATEPSSRAVAKALFPELGFADREFGCLNAMWNRLDKWGSVAEVRPGLAYVKSRYGTPCAAWDHVRETGQY